MAATSEGMDRALGATRWTTRWWRTGTFRGGRGDARYAAGIVGALAYYYLVPDPLLALPGLAAFAALAWLRLELALCLLPLTFPFWYVPKRALGHAVFPLSEIALGVCLAVAIGHLLLAWIGSDGERRGRGGWVKGAEDAEDRRVAEARQNLAMRHARPVRLSENTASHTAPTSPTSPFSMSSVSLRVLRIVWRREWRWLVIGAALLVVGTAVGVLIAVRPRDALRAFRWEIAEPLLYASLLIACLWPLAMPTTGARGHRDGSARSGAWLIGWLAGPVIAVGALFGVLGIVQVLWLRVTFTALASGNQLVTLPSVAGQSLLRATGVYYGSANSLGALLERVLPLALALLLWRVLGGTTANAKHAKIAKVHETREDEEKERRTAEDAKDVEAETESAPAAATEAEAEHSTRGEAEAEAPSAAPPFLSSASSASSAVPPSPSALSSVPSVSSGVNPLAHSPRPPRASATSALPVTPPSSLLLCACVLVMVAGMALTGSRGAELGAAVGVLLVLLAHPRTRRITLGIVVLGGLVAIWKAGALLQVALAGHGASGEVRLLLWQSALHMIRDHPLLGIGPDQFLYYYDPAYTAHPYWIPRIGGRLTPAAFQPNLAHPHNLVLDLWLSGGVMGLAGFALVLGWFAWSCWRIWRANPRMAHGPRRWTAPTALAVGVAGSVLAGLAHGMVDSAYFQPDLALLFWWAVAVVALLRIGLPERTTAPGSPSQGTPGAA